MILTKDKAQSELFNTSDTILICDTFGKVLFYQDFNDKIYNINRFKKSGLEMDDGVQQYEFEFFANDMEYSYDIRHFFGTIVKHFGNY